MTDRELMQQALDALEDLHRTGDTQVFDMCYAPKLLPALRARLAQPEPLPAKSKGALSHEENERHNKMILDKFYEENAHLYTAPPQREWQGLTDEEVRDLWSWSMTAEAERTANTQQHAFTHAIEAKLKEKNT